MRISVGSRCSCYGSLPVRDEASCPGTKKLPPACSNLRTERSRLPVKSQVSSSISGCGLLRSYIDIPPLVLPFKFIGDILLSICSRG